MAESTSRSSSSRNSGKSASPTKKGAARKSVPPRKVSANKSSSEEGNGDSADGSSPEPRGRSRAKAAARPAARASQVAGRAASELLELTGKSAEGVTGLERTEDGWTVQVEVLEVRRIPDTTDVLALYEVQTDSQGSMLGYRRVQRYTRGAAGDS